VTILGTGLALASLCAVLAFGGDRITGKSFASRSEVVARNGMAATSQPLATQVASRPAAASAATCSRSCGTRRARSSTG
jgi:hypothetical protein